MAKKKVFVSFDFEKDRHYYYLLKAWDANKNSDFLFTDCTPEEIQSEDISVVRANLTKKIKDATYTLVVVGEDANKKHVDSDEIGYRNWQNFEVAKSVENGNKLIGVKINNQYAAPEELLGVGASWATEFSQDAVIDALDNA